MKTIFIGNDIHIGRIRPVGRIGHNCQDIINVVVYKLVHIFFVFLALRNVLVALDDGYSGSKIQVLRVTASGFSPLSIDIASDPLGRYQTFEPGTLEP